MAFTAADVKKLRELTQAGMMDCKNALDETDGDFDKAVELLRVKGRPRPRSVAPSARRPPGWSPLRGRARRAEVGDRLRRQERGLRHHRPEDRRGRRRRQGDRHRGRQGAAARRQHRRRGRREPRHHHRREDRARSGRLLRGSDHGLPAQACGRPAAGRRRPRRVRRRRDRRPWRRHAGRRAQGAVPHP